MKITALLALAMASAMTASASAQPAKLPDLLIVGSPHLANPNRDDVRSNVATVTTPERQREIEALVEGLARYRPTRIAVEMQVKDQAELDARYAAYRAGGYKATASEIDQIALRLAAKLNLARLEAVDWNGMPPMAEADYNYPAWAEANGRGGEFVAWRQRLQAKVDAREARMRCTPVGQWYRELNTPAARAEDDRDHLEISSFGDSGPNWLGGSWYMRNLRIFAQLRRVAKPGDRVLVLYGASHAFPLEQYARQSGAFTLSDPLAYLPPEAVRTC